MTYQCFKLPVLKIERTNTIYHHWLNDFAQSDVFADTSQDILIALSRLIPILLCGEQSANFVFGQEVKKQQYHHELSTDNNIIDGLLSIESDEYFHDQALKAVLKKINEKLHYQQDIKKLTRQAQLFYYQIGKSDSTIQHFANIKHLDTCVTIIMSEMAKSKLGKEHLLSKLFHLIHLDEAKHVRICSAYIKYLGGDNKIINQQAKPIKTRLVALLKSESPSFITMGINPEKLFYRIMR